MNEMDIPALSTALSQAELHREVNASITKMSMDLMENSKDQFLDLLDSATVDQIKELDSLVNPHLGSNLDINV
ncbi:YjfB family protein [Natranaerofaba carboxydovora]|uniref:YjfB family protein n=1 Tax=Natranaerofaba carboxydovora TaxID=2742683 RepID=UPI001F138E7E|nr:YjfB family protein [Natranaerofaba carboxydovora]UMZ72592.1 Putative motility protein [Natranaerofaba carboxydovora]